MTNKTQPLFGDRQKRCNFAERHLIASTSPWLLSRLRISRSLTSAVVAAATLLVFAPSSEAQSPASSNSSMTAAAPTPVLRRLSRVEYANSLRDLFGIEFPFAGDLPADGQAAGFDNISDALSLSPVLLESYLRVARKVSDLVIGVGNSSPVTEQFLAKGTQSAWQEGMPLGTRGGMLVKYYFPRSGEYELRAFLSTGFFTPVEGERFFRIRIPVTAGAHTFVATFPDDYAEPEGPVPNLSGPGGPPLGGPLDFRSSAFRPTIQFWLDGKRIKSFEINAPGPNQRNVTQPGPPYLTSTEITGPFNPSAAVDTQARRRLLVCVPNQRSDEAACAAKILTPIAQRAYRREVNSADMAPVLAAFGLKRTTASFDESVGLGLVRILVSPDFLFRAEFDPAGASAGQTYRVSDYELATRVSYFLWSSLPDAKLLDHARHGRLKDKVALAREARRMLSDSKADALVENFAMQWLGLRDIATKRPDPKAYPEFEAGLAREFEQETRLFLRSVVRENRSVLDVISSDDAFLNERLARLYGIAGVKGPAFRRVKLGDNQQRGGVISQGGVLMVTSHTAATSPVLRGKWILTNLLNKPPPTPPPGVPPLDTKPASDGRILSAREQLERHNISPVCATCHTRMDPYGVALENYDVLGRWRTHDNGNPIDASAKLPRGEVFNGPAGLKKALLAQSDNFAFATVSRLMTYALGRELEKSDEPIAREIAQAAKPAGYRFADLVVGIINSAPFQMRQARQVQLTNAHE